MYVANAPEAKAPTEVLICNQSARNFHKCLASPSLCTTYTKKASCNYQNVLLKLFEYDSYILMAFKVEKADDGETATENMEKAKNILVPYSME